MRKLLLSILLLTSFVFGQRLGDLPELTAGLQDNDYFVIVDVSADTTKKIESIRLSDIFVAQIGSLNQTISGQKGFNYAVFDTLVVPDTLTPSIVGMLGLLATSDTTNVLAFVADSDLSIDTLATRDYARASAIVNGSGNQIYGMNSAGASKEWKSFLGTANEATLTFSNDTLYFGLPDSVTITSLLTVPRIESSANMAIASGGTLDVTAGNTTITPTGTLRLNPTTNITIDPGGDILFDPNGNDLLPVAGYDLNIGSSQYKYLTLHAAELWVQTLVAQDVMSTIGGTILVAPTNVLEEDITTGETSLDFKYDNFAIGDMIYFEGDGKIEFMEITGGPTGSDPFVYTVNRAEDPTPADLWYAGDAAVNTGVGGDGFIDIYSENGVYSGSGPTIVGNVRNSATYNDWSTAWAIGNLNGLYGYGTDIYGVGLGKYGSGISNVTVDPTYGFRIRNYTTDLAKWDNSGNITIGEVGAGKSNVYITSGSLQLRNNTTPAITLNTDGSATFVTTVTGGVFQTSASGQRIVLNESSTNSLRYYNATTGYVQLDGGYDGTIGAYFNINGNAFVEDALILESRDLRIGTSSVIFGSAGSGNNMNLQNIGTMNGEDDWITTGLMTALSGLRVSTVTNLDGTYLRNNGTSFVASSLNASDMTGTLPIAHGGTNSTTAITGSNVMVSNGSAIVESGTISVTELGTLNGNTVNLSTYFAPAYGDLYDNVGTSTITCDGSNYVEWAGATAGITQNITAGINYATIYDKLTINAGHGGTYKVEYSVSFYANTIGDYYWTVKDGVSPIGKGRQVGKEESTNTLRTVSNSFLWDFSAGDYVSLGCRGTNTNIVTVTYANLVLTKVGN